MAARKVFTSDSGAELSAILLESDKLFIEIKDADSAKFIVLSTEDAKDFIMELYRLKRKIG